MVSLKNFKLKSFIFVIFLFWVSVQFIVPLLSPTGSLTDLSGVVGIADNDRLVETLAFPGNLFYKAGDIMCHQKAERSFFINGNQMPFCSRCTGIFLGLTIGILISLFIKIGLDRKFMFFLIVAFSPLIIDGGGQLFGFWESNNAFRLITGLLTGFACGIAIGLIIDELAMILTSKKKGKIT